MRLLVIESRNKPTISENLQYHLTNKLPLTESVFRMGSLSWCMLINETRRLFKEGHLILTESERAIIETDAGQLGNYKGEKVPLDTPFFQYESKEYGNLFGVFTLNEGKTVKVNFCENGNNLGRLVAESEKTENYMFIQNLKNLIKKASEILQIPQEELDKSLQGHQWAVDHITTSVDDVDEVNGFLMHRDEVQEFMNEANKKLNEKNKDGGLKRWFKEKWVDVSRKVDGKHPPCGREDADKGAYPKCRPKKKVSKDTPKTASSYSKKEKKSMTAKKRKAETKPRKGKKPNYTTEEINETKLCARGKAAAKAKYDVYPSAYANAYAVKVCKGQVAAGGKKETASGYQKKKGKPKNESVEMMETLQKVKEYLQRESVISEDYDFDMVQEAEYRGKKVKLNKPFRQASGGKKFAVYVKSKKGNVKKVRFGAQGYKVKNTSKGRASNFQKRHNCKDKKDRTKAGYWSCNVGRYAKQLGLSSKRKW